MGFLAVAGLPLGLLGFLLGQGPGEFITLGFVVLSAWIYSIGFVVLSAWIRSLGFVVRSACGSLLLA